MLRSADCDSDHQLVWVKITGRTFGTAKKGAKLHRMEVLDKWTVEIFFNNQWNAAGAGRATELFAEKLQKAAEEVVLSRKRSGNPGCVMTLNVPN